MSGSRARELQAREVIDALRAREESLEIRVTGSGELKARELRAAQEVLRSAPKAHGSNDVLHDASPCMCY